MGWQDILGGALTGFATGNPMAWQNTKLEQAMKQFQKQKISEQLEMQKDMHKLEQMKAEMQIKHLAQTMEQENAPAAPWIEMFGGNVPQGQEGLTVGQAKNIAPLGDVFTKQKPKYEQVKGSNKISFFNPKDPNDIVQTEMDAGVDKPVNVPSWADALGLQKFGEKYHTVQGQKDFANWLADPKNQKEVETFQSLYSLRNAPPGVTYLQTNQGFVPMPTKGGGVPPIGQPTGFGSKLPSEQVVAEQQIGTLLETLQTVKSLYKPKYVGPVAGRLSGLQEQTVGLGEEEAIFRSANAQLQNSLIYLMSGKQINESEYQRLKKQIPDVTLPESVYTARVKEFERTVQSIIDNRRKNMGGYGTQSTGKTSKPPLASFDKE